MTVLQVAQLVTLLVGVALVGLVVALVAVKLMRDRKDRRVAALQASLRPLVLEALEDDGQQLDLAGRSGEVTEELVVSMLGHLRGSDRRRLAEVLEQGGTLGRARRGLGSRSAARRQQCAELLGAAGDETAAGVLVDRLGDRDEMVRMAAARALGRIGATSAVEPLVDCLERRTIPANTVSMAIMRIGPAGSAALVPALSSRYARVRATAAELLGTFGHVEATEQLEVQLADAERAAAIGAAHALGRLGMPRSSALLERELTAQLDTPQSYERDEYVVALITALGQIGNRECIPTLTRCLGETHQISHAAAEALAPMGQRRSRRSEQLRAAGTGEGVSGKDVSGDDVSGEAVTPASLLAVGSNRTGIHP